MYLLQIQNGLAGNFRTETVNITDVVRSHSSQYKSFFIQGAQRWQSITLTQGNSLTLSYIGFEPTAATTARQDVSGDSTLQDSNSTFSCNNDLFNRIWNMGPKAAEISCSRGPGSLPSVWEQAGSNGVLIRGQRPKRSANMTGKLPMSGYTFSFQTQIVRTGFGFVVDAAVSGYGPFCEPGHVQNGTQTRADMLPGRQFESRPICPTRPHSQHSTAASFLRRL